MRALRVLAAPALAAALGACAAGRPSPEDPSRGAERVLAAVAPLFGEGVLDRGVLARSDAAAPLESLASAWRAEAVGLPPRLRLYGVALDGPRRAVATLRIRLRGTARRDAVERVAATRLFLLKLVRESRATPWRLAEAASLDASPPSIQRGRARLVESAKAMGLDAEPVPGGASTPAGVVLCDVDGDGALDVVLAAGPPRLFRNDGAGRFADATPGSGLDAIGGASGVAAADLDGDGLPELILLDASGAPRVLRNAGEGRFQDVTADWGLGTLPARATSVAVFDADRDDRLDLFVAAGASSRFLRGAVRDGHPFFVDETGVSGLARASGAVVAAACDFDGDGDDDLAVGDGRRLVTLFENRTTNGAPRFVDVTKDAGIHEDGRGSAVAWGDAEGAARFDLFVAGSARAGLFRNLGGRRFARAPEPASVPVDDEAWSAELADVDGDGRPDIVVATAGDSPKRLFLNRGDGAFEDRAFVDGLDTLEDTASVAVGDLDGDGAPEIVFATRRGTLLVYRNLWAAPERRIRVRLAVPAGANRDAVGAMVTLSAGGKRQLREVRAGSRELLFGLGDAAAAEEIEVRWPGGRVERTGPVPGGRRVIWSEGEEPRVLPFRP